MAKLEQEEQGSPFDAENFRDFFHAVPINGPCPRKRETVLG